MTHTHTHTHARTQPKLPKKTEIIVSVIDAMQCNANVVHLSTFALPIYHWQRRLIVINAKWYFFSSSCRQMLGGSLASGVKKYSKTFEFRFFFAFYLKKQKWSIRTYVLKTICCFFFLMVLCFSPFFCCKKIELHSKIIKTITLSSCDVYFRYCFYTRRYSLSY